MQPAIPQEELVVIIVALTVVATCIVVQVLMLWMIYSSLSAIPPEYRSIEPPLVWFGLIGIVCCIFSMVWNFILYIKTADSFERFFVTHDRLEFGDCGRGLGIAAGVCSCLVLVPVIAYLAWLIAPVLHIIVVLKYWAMKRAVEETLASSVVVEDDGDPYGDDRVAPEDLL